MQRLSEIFAVPSKAIFPVVSTVLASIDVTSLTVELSVTVNLTESVPARLFRLAPIKSACALYSYVKDPSSPRSIVFKVAKSLVSTVSFTAKVPALTIILLWVVFLIALIALKYQ